jgi:hypothetical protein
MLPTEGSVPQPVTFFFCRPGLPPRPFKNFRFSKSSQLHLIFGGIIIILLCFWCVVSIHGPNCTDDVPHLSGRLQSTQNISLRRNKQVPTAGEDPPTTSATLGQVISAGQAANRTMRASETRGNWIKRVRSFRTPSGGNIAHLGEDASVAKAWVTRLR